jgi:peptidyl-prolyl cis-trans isomerase A (cyclophilin A)
MRGQILLLAMLGWGSAQMASALLMQPDSPEFTRPAAAVTIVRLETTKGDIDIEVTRDWAPLGADRFVNLARLGYYDGNRIFRISPGRWVQFGINGEPMVAKPWRNRTLRDDPFKQSNVRGTVAFAFATPNGRTTQIFFNMTDNRATHDKEPFVPFGRVLGSGMAVVESFNAEHGEGPGGIRAGKQDPFFEGGNTWLDKAFPRLDTIKHASTRIVVR